LTTDLALRDENYLAAIPDMAKQFARSGMCPAVFRGKPDDVAVVAYSLASLGVRLSFPTLSQCYVVHGKPGLMCQLQSALAARQGVDIHPVPEKCDDTTATVAVTDRTGGRHEVTFTMAEAERAGLTKPAASGEPSMYSKWPGNMLVARATTRAASWYCPEVKLGLAAAGTVNAEEADVLDADPETGEIREPLNVPAMSPAPDGHTIPEHLREPAIDDDARQALLDRLDGLAPHVLEQVKGEARELAIPNLKSNRVTRAHGVLVAMLIEKALMSLAPDQAADGPPIAEPAPQEPETQEAFGYADGQEPF
jgi:hypothetical protein